MALFFPSKKAAEQIEQHGEVLCGTGTPWSESGVVYVITTLSSVLASGPEVAALAAGMVGPKHGANPM